MRLACRRSFALPLLVASTVTWGASCDSPTWLVVDIEVQAGAHPRDTKLSIAIDSAPMHEATVDASKLPGTVGVLLPDQAANVAVTLSATDAAGCVLGATAMKQSVSHQSVQLALTLAAEHALHCCNAARDGDETDVDCGGSCGGCDVAHACAVNADCATATCANKLCVLSSAPPVWASNLPLPKAAIGVGAVATPGDSLTSVGGAIDGGGTLPLPIADAWTLRPDGNWTALPVLATARFMPGAVALPDGSVWAIGGLSSQAVQSSVEILKSGGKSWTAGTALGVARYALGAAIAGDGRIYAVGGRGTATDLPDVESIAPGETSWRRAAPLPAARSTLAVASDARGRLYAIGGRAMDADRAEVWRYDPAADAWTAVAPLPSPASYVAAALAPDGRIWVTAAFGAVAYTPETNRWDTVAAPPERRMAPGLAALGDGRLVAVGGTIPGQKALGTVDAYGPRIAAAQVMSSTGGTGHDLRVRTLSPFAASAEVQLFDVASSSTTPIATFTTDLNGAFPSTIVTLPASSATTEKLLAVDNRSRYPITLDVPIQ